MKEPTENQIRQRVQRLVEIESAETPSFEEVLSRPKNDHRSVVTLRTVGFVVGCTLLVATAWYGLSNWKFEAAGPRHLNLDLASDDTKDLGLDFEAMVASIDTHFENANEWKWMTPTDTLLNIELGNGRDESYEK